MLIHRTLVALLAAALLANVSTAQSPLAPAATPATAASFDPKADEVLKKTVAFYKSLKSFTCDLKSETKVNQPGMVQVFSSSYSLAVEKPNKLAVVMNDGGNGGTYVSDGKQETIFIPATDKYVTDEAPQDLVEAADYAEMALSSASVGGMVAVAMLSDDPYAKLTAGVTAMKYIGEEDLDGVKAHHIQFSSQEVDVDLWINAGEQPLVRKLVPDLSRQIQASRQAKGMKVASFAEFSNWAVDAAIPPEKFAFTPPAGVTEASTLAALFGQQDMPSPLLGRPAPPIDLVTIDGGKFNLADHKDKVVVLDFWTTWHSPSVKSVPILARIADSYKDKGVVFCFVNEQETQDAIAPFLKDKSLQLNVALDSTGQVGQEYAVAGIPQTVVIGKDGTVQAVHVGFGPGMKRRLTNQIDSLLKGETLAKPEPVGPVQDGGL